MGNVSDIRLVNTSIFLWDKMSRSSSQNVFFKIVTDATTVAIQSNVSNDNLTSS